MCPISSFSIEQGELCGLPSLSYQPGMDQFGQEVWRGYNPNSPAFKIGERVVRPFIDHTVCPAINMVGKYAVRPLIDHAVCPIVDTFKAVFWPQCSPQTEQDGTQPLSNQQRIALDRLHFMHTLSTNQEFLRHYYSMTGEEIPSSESLLKMIQERTESQIMGTDEVATEMVDQDLDRLLQKLNTAMRSHWCLIPEKIRMLYGEISPTLELQNPRIIQEIFAIIHDYNLAAVGYAAVSASA